MATAAAANLRVEPRRAATCIRLSRWVAALVVLDFAAALLSAMVALVIRFGDRSASVGGVPYVLLALVLPVAWVTSMAVAGSYERGILAAGAEEFARVFNGAVWLLATIAFTSFLLRADLSRAIIVVSVPLATLLTLLIRFTVRKRLHREVMRGGTIHRVLAVGGSQEIGGLIRHMRRESHTGFSVVGAWMPEPGPHLVVDGHEIPVADQGTGILEAVRSLEADTIAVAGTAALAHSDLQRLSWQLEGSGISLLVAPAITDVAGPRIRVRPVGGLPLLHVDEPRFTGPQRLVKEFVDVVGASIVLLLLLPLMAAIAVLVKLSSRGPVFFRQQRIGMRGEPVTVWKFRTMYMGADRQRQELSHLNQHKGPLFKIKNDPRITRVGRWLRRYSLDELPQLWNVVSGTMSLVGPRPPLPDEVEQYAEHVHRRLLVKPGMTGLWQVSGRSNISWEESVRLDLYYVEHWSLMLDIMVMWKTIGAVTRSHGAY